jgi:UDP-2,4-diacetamido-2,4,6-trideoxy-beta-L-altropyranose hydrolase
MKLAATSMQIVFRADASLEIGTGHIMRCLTLARALSETGAQPRFICRRHDGNLIDLIQRHGFLVHALPMVRGPKILLGSDPGSMHCAWLGCDWQTDVEQCQAVMSGVVDWIVVDHYSIDKKWEGAMRSKCHHIMVIDDLADRHHDCDLLLDQSLGRNKENYKNLLCTKTRLLLGPQYALLRPEFIQWRDISLARRHHPEMRHIMVTMGGSDVDNVTSRILRVIAQCRLTTLEKITVVLGPHFPWRETVHSLALDMRVPTTVVSSVENMAELMTASDLVIGAGGATTWERCSLGVPSVLIALADNQANIARQMSLANAAFVIEDINKLDTALMMFLESSELSHRAAMYARKSAKMSDATGVVEIVAQLGGSRG